MKSYLYPLRSIEIVSLLQVENITKKFSGVTALDQVSMNLESGEVLALIGENGAGKSTLLKIMSGIYTDYTGSIFYAGKKVKFSSPREAQELGISIIHQELNLIPELSITQNIFLGREEVDRFGFLDERKMHSVTNELLGRLKMEVSPSTLVGVLKVGEQQLVEIAKALLLDSKVLFMDEPTSALGESEIDTLFQIINELKQDGRAIVYISHKLDELYDIADGFLVLRDGQQVGHGSVDQISRDQLVEMMAGRKVKRVQRPPRSQDNKVMLEVRNLTRVRTKASARTPLDRITFKLYQGEILGIYGLMGAGRTELCECLFGLHPKTISGSIYLDGSEVKFKSPMDAKLSGMALVPEDRKKHGIIPDWSIVKNMSLTDVNKVEVLGLIDGQLEEQLYERHLKSLKIKASSPTQLIKKLSGGNQQKVVLAKWIECNPRVLILDEPTRGIDINAKNEIYDLIDQLSAGGISIIVVSSEIPEILRLADRILIMSEGRITEVLSAEEASESKIMSASIPKDKVK